MGYGRNNFQRDEITFEKLNVLQTSLDNGGSVVFFVYFALQPLFSVFLQYLNDSFPGPESSTRNQREEVDSWGSVQGEGVMCLFSWMVTLCTYSFMVIGN